MISFLTGIIHHKDLEAVTVLINGVGYKAAVTPSVLNKLNSGDQVELYIHAHIRDDVFDLYGFLSKEDLVLFKLLISVSGVGPKTGMLVMDKGAANIRQAIGKADTGFFTLVPRLGKKNAQRIIIELKNKIGTAKDLDLAGGSETNEVVEALKAMGYSFAEAAAMIKNMPDDLGKLEEKVKWSLKNK
jgi:Holliday junction DNA helicase RuvA